MQIIYFISETVVFPFIAIIYLNLKTSLLLPQNASLTLTNKVLYDIRLYCGKNAYFSTTFSCALN